MVTTTESDPNAIPPISNADGKTLQRLAEFGGYTGPIDGVPGTNTWKGVQTVLGGYGYTGPINGVPDTDTCMALQRLAQEGGYTGPIDGVPGPSTYAGVAVWVTAHTPPTSNVGVYGIDVSGYQDGLNFPDALAAKLQWAMVKEGGSNVSPTYVTTSYASLVDGARSAGMLLGHYWVSGYGVPEDDAAFFVQNLHDYRPGDLLALDNEGIDSGIVWNDSQTAAFVSAVKTALGVAPFFYTTRNILKSQAWTATQAAGAQLWIADPNHAPGSPQIFNYSDWAIHQYGQGSIDGIAVDLNMAKLSAFTVPTPDGETDEPTIPTLDEGVTAQRIAKAGGYTGPVDGVPGTNTWKGAQTVLTGYGYTGPQDGVPGTETYKALQRLATKGGYTGPIDGAPGTNTWKGVQTVLRGFGYTGPIDGAPGTNTYMAFQRMAGIGGYTGTINGTLDVDSWKGIQKLFSGAGYCGPIDGVPGTNTYEALQVLAQSGGYSGPIDGIPDPAMWSSLAALIR